MNFLSGGQSNFRKDRKDRHHGRRRETQTAFRKGMARHYKGTASGHASHFWRGACNMTPERAAAKAGYAREMNGRAGSMDFSLRGKNARAMMVAVQIFPAHICDITI